MITPEDLKGYTGEELTEAYRLIVTEREERYKKEVLPQQIAENLAELQTVEGTRPGQGQEWVQPTGATDAYIAGDMVTHGGKEWVSLTTPNVWEPGVSGWHENSPEGSDTPAEWIQPTGGHDTYKIGDRVLFEGESYESVIDNNSWSPTAHPAGWKKI